MTTKYYYNYNSINFEYLGFENAYLDPEETKIAGTEVYSLPAFATFIEPPKVKEQETIVFDIQNQSWKIEPDYRGMYQVDKNMQPEEIINFGELPKGYIPITKAQAIKINEDKLYYIIQNDELIINPNYDEEKEQMERERISHLKCTKRVFILMLEQLGLDYFEQIEPLINANRQAKLEWELCVELERANPLLDLMGEQLGITPAQIDNLFKYANGEINESEFLNVN